MTHKCSEKILKTCSEVLEMYGLQEKKSLKLVYSLKLFMIIKHTYMSMHSDTNTFHMSGMSRQRKSGQNYSHTHVPYTHYS